MSTRVLVSADCLNGPCQAIKQAWCIVAIAVPLFLFATPGPAEAEIEIGKSAFIQIQVAQLREEPKHWARRMAAVPYGDEVSVLSSLNGWLKVRTTSGLEGFLHQSALSDRAVIIAGKSGTKGIESSASEVVLAGKGFNEEVVREVAKERGDLNFTALERIEKVTVTAEMLRIFLEEGGLAGASS